MTQQADRPAEKTMRLRYAGTCRICGSSLEAGARAVYEKAGRTVRCLEHRLEGPEAAEPAAPVVPERQMEPTPVDAGTAGASARREHDKRRTRREERIRAQHPRIGGLVLALTDDPRSTTVWRTGAVGEERLGRRLDELASSSIRLLHDRRLPRSRANIDHLAVTPSGVWVIDAKRYAGRPERRDEGGLLRPRTQKLVVGGRDRTPLVDGVLGQVAVVRGLVGEDVPVRGVLCFIEADWPLVGGHFTVGDVDVVRPKKMYPWLHRDGPLDEQRIDAVHRLLAGTLRPA